MLRDSFTRLIEHVDDLTDGLTDAVALFRPTPRANTITWLIWHSARIQDAQLCDIAGLEQVWFRDGWVDRFALDLPRDAHGYGHTPEEVGQGARAGRTAGRLLPRGAQGVAGVHRVGDGRRTRPRRRQRWTPPVTASARLVSIIDDAAQHLGQAAYVRGIAG